ncbi:MULTISPECIES: glycosyltransferase family 4 protein [unclassified Coleofasciculus]|uniref:glycosyltransferase family 4 protein n=1 Tax=unclassified Coleofasciculus TaxID=2692782 RepID=UPI001D143689|nr:MULTISPECIES: glycosyltransferase family 4 protein [unclassified Coleofasciculus]
MNNLKKSSIKLGIICNEFFALSQGRMGGFGWAASQVAECFNSDPDLGVEVVFLAGEAYAKPGEPDPIVHNTRLILRQHNKLAYARRIWREKIDLILSIDYRPNYRPLFWILPRTPIILWVRDPRPPEDVAKIDTVRIPGAENVYPQGLKCFDCTSFAQVFRISQWLSRPVLFATPAPFLKDKVLGTYGVEPSEVTFLPNIIDMEPGDVVKSEKPTVVFLARLDPYKRPWLFAELARHFPDVEFIFMGKLHFEGEGAWEPTSLPDNVKLMGHVGGVDKIRILSEAWVLINTSIHEGLAVSFQEALKCETPILSCLDPENVVSRFGIYVGR